MPEDLMEHMYCSQQINIPPNLPFILKQYAKAAIRTQPYDLLYWSAAYFRAKANDTPPPVKDRLEYPPVDSPSRLSPGFLKVLHKQLGENIHVSQDVLYEKWLGVCLVSKALDSMLKVGCFYGEIPWLKFVAIAAGHLCPSLSRTMVLICEVLTEEPEGGSAMIPVETFVDLYKWLAELDCGSEPPVLPEIPPTPSSLHLTDSAAASHGSSVKDNDSVMDVTVVGMTEKDSTAGLMVWPDVRPEEKPERLSSPKHTDEPGASSELGIEVLDDATGVVTEVVTLYPVQTEQTSHETVETPAQAEQISQTKSGGSNVLSHSSLRENDDWIKIPAYQHPNEPPLEHLMEDEVQSAGSIKIEEIENINDATEEARDPEDLETESKSKTLTDQERIEGGATLDQGEVAEEPQSISEKTLKSAKSEVKQNSEKTLKSTKSEVKQSSEKTLQSAKSEVKQSSEKTLSSAKSKVKESSDKTLQSAKSDVKQSSKKTPSSAKSEAKPIGEDGNMPSTEKLQESEEEINTLELTDSILGPGESITVQQFIKNDPEGSLATYSTVEIRQDMVGDESKDKIERTSSEDVVQAARTRHCIVEHESSEQMAQGISQGMSQAKTVASENVSSESSSLPEEEPWQHVPGIGPIVPPQQVLAVVEYMQYWAAKQHGMVMPRNINHILCPPLDLPPPSASDQCLPQEY